LILLFLIQHHHSLSLFLSSIFRFESSLVVVGFLDVSHRLSALVAECFSVETIGTTIHASDCRVAVVHSFRRVGGRCCLCSHDITIAHVCVVGAAIAVVARAAVATSGGRYLGRISRLDKYFTLDVTPGFLRWVHL